jgi:ferredoxin
LHDPSCNIRPKGRLFSAKAQNSGTNPAAPFCGKTGQRPQANELPNSLALRCKLHESVSTHAICRLIRSLIRFDETPAGARIFVPARPRHLHPAAACYAGSLMTYVVTAPCLKCKYTDCVEVCPVDCFREDAEMLIIDPASCIDCGACVPTCPVDAIFEDKKVPEQYREWIRINAEKAPLLPMISEKKPPLAPS